MIIPINIKIINVEFISSNINESDPIEKTEERIDIIDSDIVEYPLSIWDINNWYEVEGEVIVNCERSGAISLNINLEKFENLLKDSMEKEKPLLKQRELEIFDYLIKKNVNRIQRNMFEG